MIRACAAVMSNIAERFERGGNKEFVYFLPVARGSIGEVQSQLLVAFDQEYLNQGTFDHIMNLAAEIGRLIGELMKYLRGSSYRGAKHK
jgi:four helix bundle protein